MGKRIINRLNFFKQLKPKTRVRCIPPNSVLKEFSDNQLSEIFNVNSLQTLLSQYEELTEKYICQYLYLYYDSNKMIFWRKSFFYRYNRIVYYLPVRKLLDILTGRNY